MRVYVAQVFQSELRRFVPEDAVPEDDVITRTATFLAMFQRLTEASPQAEVRCFAIVRTRSGAEIDRVMSPVEGMISSSGAHLLRQP